MKNNPTWAAIRLCILGLLSSLCGLFNVNPSMGAKTGIITAPTGADDNLKTLGASQPVRDTLMGVVRSALQLAVAVKTAIINFGVRKAIIVPSATNIATVTGATDVVLQSTFTRQIDGTWQVANEGGAEVYVTGPMGEIIAAAAPKLSVESLVNKIEEASDVIKTNDAAESLMVTFDQADGLIKVHLMGNTSAATVHAAAVALAEDVQFVQTVESAGATQFGE